jgi:hypothetical protein
MTITGVLFDDMDVTGRLQYAPHHFKQQRLTFLFLPLRELTLSSNQQERNHDRSQAIPNIGADVS